ncbi:MAG: YccF domain-containing protein [Microthrixaceae bacterium]
MKTIGNILWLVLAGFWQAIGYVLAGALCCITIIGIPFGIQAFKLAGFVIWPFGREVVRDSSGGVLETVFNVIWLVLVGWALFVASLASALVLCITIIGIPFGIQSVKIGVLGLWPFGHTFAKT